MPELISQVISDKPTISLDSKCLPAIKNWKVGKTYTIHLKVRETGVHEDKFENDKTRLDATFEVIKAEDYDD
jgi:hypothetical protein